MDISLITPLRAQPEEFTELCSSLRQTTEDLSRVELLLAVDLDDVATSEFLDQYVQASPDLKIRVFLVERSEHFVRDYYNFLSRQARGRWIMAINADSVFLTPNWDRLVCEAMERAAKKFGDDILLGIVHDGLPRQNDPVIDHTRAIFPEKVDFSCWPILSREYVKLMGGMFDEENYAWGADHWLGRTFVNLRGGERLVYMRYVKVDHKSHHTKIEVPQKESFARFCEIMGKHPMKYTEQQARAIAAKLERYLNEVQNVRKTP